MIRLRLSFYHRAKACEMMPACACVCARTHLFFRVVKTSGNRQWKQRPSIILSPAHSAAYVYMYIHSGSWALCEKRADCSALSGIVRMRGCAPRGLDPPPRQARLRYEKAARCVCAVALPSSLLPNKAKLPKTRDKVKWDLFPLLPAALLPNKSCSLHQERAAVQSTARNYYISPSAMQMGREIGQLFFFTFFSLLPKSMQQTEAAAQQTNGKWTVHS